MPNLQLLAGSSAYRRIQQHPLKSDDISAVFGASGAAKWLTIYGLDRAIFSQWLQSGNNPIDLFGTSIGAFKLTAAAQSQPAEAFTRLANAYVEQSYTDNDASPEAICRETKKILAATLNQDAATQVLNNPRFRFHCGVVSSDGLLGSANLNHQKMAMLKGFLLATRGRRAHKKMLKRSIFGPPSSQAKFGANDGVSTDYIALNESNFQSAVLASGSIPVVMHGVDSIPGTQPNTIFRDGGLLDYHPVPGNFMDTNNGIVLYPHFYPHLVEGWFDKFFPWRKVSPKALDNVLIVAPSAEFVRSLPGGKIPDRQDFVHYRGRDHERQALWREVMSRSLELGEEWLELCASGKLAQRVQLLSAKG